MSKIRVRSSIQNSRSAQKTVKSPRFVLKNRQNPWSVKPILDPLYKTSLNPLKTLCGIHYGYFSKLLLKQKSSILNEISVPCNSNKRSLLLILINQTSGTGHLLWEGWGGGNFPKAISYYDLPPLFVL